jgi:hypothetical protein
MLNSRVRIRGRPRSSSLSTGCFDTGSLAAVDGRRATSDSDILAWKSDG